MGHRKIHQPELRWSLKLLYKGCTGWLRGYPVIIPPTNVDPAMWGHFSIASLSQGNTG